MSMPVPPPSSSRKAAARAPSARSEMPRPRLGGGWAGPVWGRGEARQIERERRRQQRFMFLAIPVPDY